MPKPTIFKKGDNLIIKATGRKWHGDPLPTSAWGGAREWYGRVSNTGEENGVEWLLLYLQGPDPSDFSEAGIYRYRDDPDPEIARFWYLDGEPTVEATIEKATLDRKDWLEQQAYEKKRRGGNPRRKAKKKGSRDAKAIMRKLMRGT